ncbi:MAG: tail fiber assembly protein [Candidatus Phlomobacter fragariae]
MWDGEKWVKDVEDEKLVERRKLEAIKQQKLSDITYAIALLQDAVDLDIAPEEEKKQLIAWKRYCVLINRIDTSTTQDITWPEEPA